SCNKSSISHVTLPGGTDSTSTRISASANNTISFTGNGQAAIVDKIAVSETNALGYPYILAMARAIIPSTHDTLVLVLQFNDNNNTAYGKFLGIYADTTRTGKTAYCNIMDTKTIWQYSPDHSQGTYIYTNIATNDGTTISGTFNGNLRCSAADLSTLGYFLITNGTFKLKL
ncbi:MAG TPA: hypothetical protein VI233_10930, partial [Puia sp.]